jgi:hypothetical protein
MSFSARAIDRLAISLAFLWAINMRLGRWCRTSMLSPSRTVTTGPVKRRHNEMVLKRNAYAKNEVPTRTTKLPLIRPMRPHMTLPRIARPGVATSLFFLGEVARKKIGSIGFHVFVNHLSCRLKLKRAPANYFSVKSFLTYSNIKTMPVAVWS